MTYCKNQSVVFRFVTFIISHSYYSIHNKFYLDENSKINSLTFGIHLLNIITVANHLNKCVFYNDRKHRVLHFYCWSISYHFCILIQVVCEILTDLYVLFCMFTWRSSVPIPAGVIVNTLRILFVL